MTCTIPIPISIETATFPAGEWTGQTELVRGTEDALLARLGPLVRRQSVTLDMSSVQRIDAAGIAALIALYAGARDAGQCFNVVNPSPHVAEILALVGLERFLVSQNVVDKSHSSPSSIAPLHENTRHSSPIRYM